MSKVKSTEERAFYIHHTVAEKLSLDALKASIARDDYHHQGNLPNNFMRALPAAEQAFRAINTFKDEYLLDYMHDLDFASLHGEAFCPTKIADRSICIDGDIGEVLTGIE